ncbi:MAG: hypothetical protein BJ554DRAFT_7491, partial [Olpidium bornovanus]
RPASQTTRSPALETPGPANYIISGVGRSGPQAILIGRTAADESIFPSAPVRRTAAAAAPPPASSSSPSSSCPVRLPAIVKAAASTPGPAEYAVAARFQSIGHTGPAFALGTKFRERAPAPPPGPNQYDTAAAAAAASENDRKKRRVRGPSFKGRPSPFMLVFPNLKVGRLPVYR